MGNTTDPKGFRPAGRNPLILEFTLPASQTIAAGDMVTFDTDGTVIIATGASTKLLGAAAEPVTSSSAGDKLKVYCDPDQIFIGEIGTGALVQPYTTMTLTSAYDIAGSTGGQYINQSDTGSDMMQVICPATETNGDNKGLESAWGTYTKVYCRINIAAHCLGGKA